MAAELYKWQEECLKQWFANKGRGMVQAVTGSGKTFLALNAADQLEKSLKQPLRIKIVVPTSSLMWQWNRKLREFIAASSKEESSNENGSSKENKKRMHGTIGLRGDGCKSSPDCKYMIYVINSARYELARQILSELQCGQNVLLIADECHHYESGQNRLIFEFLPYVKPYESHFFSLGLTATLPSGPSQHYLASVLGRKIYSYGMAQASAYRTVCQYHIFHIGLTFTKEERQEYGELTEQIKVLYYKLMESYSFLPQMDQKERYELLKRLCKDKDPEIAQAASSYLKITYKRKKVACLASARITCTDYLIRQLIHRQKSDEKILVFGERISQAEELFWILQAQYPGRVGKYHSKMGIQANKNVLERFRAGDVRILIACKSMDEGIDIPEVSIGIILSGTSTMRQRMQRLGRIIRKNKEKSNALLYYLHVTETSEESYFLPEYGQSLDFDLEFDAKTQRMYHPRYDQTAGKLLNRMYRAGVKKEQIKEARRCLLQGSIRTDWLLEQKEVEEQIKKAKHVSDKNYWFCMKKLGEINRNYDSYSANKSTFKA